MLKCLKREIMEELKSANETKQVHRMKKILFKTYRDMARVSALKREQVNAESYHNKAERILKEELCKFKEEEFNIKVAKLQLLKGIWMTKFEFSKSNDEIFEAYRMFTELYGTEDNYFSANCQFEIGSNNLKLKQP